jgi:hypothetical protein
VLLRNKSLPRREIVARMKFKPMILQREKQVSISSLQELLYVNKLNMELGLGFLM